MATIASFDLTLLTSVIQFFASHSEPSPTNYQIIQYVICFLCHFLFLIVVIPS